MLISFYELTKICVVHNGYNNIKKLYLLRMIANYIIYKITDVTILKSINHKKKFNFNN